MTAEHGHPHPHQGEHHHDEAHVVTSERGRLEVSIFEDGVPPRFRIRFFDSAGAPMAPSEQNVVTIETQRAGGGRQTFAFEINEGQYLEATEELPEPHEFNAVLAIAHGDHSHSFEMHFAEHQH